LLALARDSCTDGRHDGARGVRIGHTIAQARSRRTRSFAMTPRTRPASADATPRGYSTPATTDAVRAEPLDAVELRLGRWWKPRGAAGERSRSERPLTDGT